MFARLSTFVFALTAARIAVAHPLAHPEPHPEPEMDLVERAGLAAVYSSCTTVSNPGSGSCLPLLTAFFSIAEHGTGDFFAWKSRPDIRCY